MSTTERLVELVLTGLLFLLAMLLPALMLRPVPFELSGEVLSLGIAVALGMGVLVDRAGDTMLGYAESLERMSFAKKVEPGVVDPFPIHWMRTRLLESGSSALIKRVDRLRLRIRIARSVAVVTPLFALSGCVAVIGLEHSERVRELIALCAPVCSLALLIGGIGCTRDKLDTRDEDDREVPSQNSTRNVIARTVGHGTLGLAWMVTVVAAVLCVVFAGWSTRSAFVVATTLAAVCVFILALTSWRRISHTFWRFHAGYFHADAGRRDELHDAMRRAECACGEGVTQAAVSATSVSPPAG